MYRTKPRGDAEGGLSLRATVLQCLGGTWKGWEAGDRGLTGFAPYVDEALC